MEGEGYDEGERGWGLRECVKWHARLLGVFWVMVLHVRMWRWLW